MYDVAQVRRALLLSGVALFASSLLGCSTPRALPPPQAATTTLALNAKSLPVKRHPQETNLWCWAATGQMVMEFLGQPVTQCEQANKAFNKTDCPCQQCGTSPDPNPPCVLGNWPMFSHYGFKPKTTNNVALSFAELSDQMCTGSPSCKGEPVAFVWTYVKDNTQHMMVAKGVRSRGGVDYVSVIDPLPVCRGGARLMTYDYFNELKGHHTHRRDYYDFEKVGP